MISDHTKQSVPVTHLVAMGQLTYIGGDTYRLDIPPRKGSGAGVASYWTADAGEHEIIESLACCNDFCS